MRRSRAEARRPGRIQEPRNMRDSLKVGSFSRIGGSRRRCLLVLSLAQNGREPMKNSPKQLRVVTRPRSGSSATAKIAPLLSVLGCLVTLLYAAPAQAQTRTWVSGVGNDANPCSRTAPCKTFAGAISKTAAGGEIDCLDPGGFGAVTITKSITIDCDGTFGSILASGVNGININDSASGFPNTIRVIIRGLSINGAGGGVQNSNGNPGSGVI